MRAITIGCKTKHEERKKKLYKKIKVTHKRIKHTVKSGREEEEKQHTRIRSKTNYHLAQNVCAHTHSTLIVQLLFAFSLAFMR